MSWGACALVVSCTAVQHTTNAHTPQDRHLAAPRTPYAAFVKEIINFYCSWRWAYRPETCRTKINKYLHQVGNWLLFQTKCKVQLSIITSSLWTLPGKQEIISPKGQHLRPRIEENENCDNFKKHSQNEAFELIYCIGNLFSYVQCLLAWKRSSHYMASGVKAARSWMRRLIYFQCRCRKGWFSRVSYMASDLMAKQRKKMYFPLPPTYFCVSVFC